MGFKYRNVVGFPVKDGEWHIKEGIYRIKENGILRIKDHWQNRHRSAHLIPSVKDRTRRSYFKLWCVDKNGKEKKFSIPVALLIASAFLPREEDDDWKVNFKDGDISNFSFDNLEWAKRTLKESDIVDDSEQTAEEQPEAEHSSDEQTEVDIVSEKVQEEREPRNIDPEAPQNFDLKWMRDLFFSFSYFTIRYAILINNLSDVNNMLVRNKDFSLRLFNDKGVFVKTNTVLTPFMPKPGEHVYMKLTLESSLEMEVVRSILIPDHNEILVLLK